MMYYKSLSFNKKAFSLRWRDSYLLELFSAPDAVVQKVGEIAVLRLWLVLFVGACTTLQHPNTTLEPQ